MKTNVRVIVVTLVVTVVIVVAGLIYVLTSQSAASPPDSRGEDPQVVRANSHILDDAGEDAVTVVEFLDFECEACGAFYPVVEDLRNQYAGQVTYVVRYFPLPSHANSQNAALAAEAAAEQGRFEDMYKRLFETQSQWGEAAESRADVFRGFAEKLGLDMAAYDAAVASPATLAQVQEDFNEGRALGVSSTPTFFVDGEKVVLERWMDLPDAIEQALNGS